MLLFAEPPAEKQLGGTLKGSKVFAVLPLPIDTRKTQAVLAGALAEAVASKAAASAAPASHTEPGIGALRGAVRALAQHEPQGSGRQRTLLLIGAAVAAAAVAGGAFWFFTRGHGAAAGSAAPAAAARVGAGAFRCG